MGDFGSAMLVCSGWLASILVGVAIDFWRARRRLRGGIRHQRLRHDVTVERRFGARERRAFPATPAADLAQHEIS
ncbi:MAG TPA: hypothetical protein VME41_03365 [Stellaceae bacterium]|nr:hypothetical protein [Stellaceae bacterium]